MNMKVMKIAMSLSILLLMPGIFAMEAIAHEWMAPEKAANVKNPVVLDYKSVAQGKKAYINDCAACHGDNLEGLDAKDSGLEKRTPNLKKRLKTHNDGDFHWKIQKGRGDMPSFKAHLSDDQIWQIINYIRSEVK